MKKKLIRAPKNKNGNVTGQISSLFKQKTIEQKFDWGIFWKRLKKKKSGALMLLLPWK